jgi:hypothetical protein
VDVNGWRLSQILNILIVIVLIQQPVHYARYGKLKRITDEMRRKKRKNIHPDTLDYIPVANIRVKKWSKGSIGVFLAKGFFPENSMAEGTDFPALRPLTQPTPLEHDVFCLLNRAEQPRGLPVRNIGRNWDTRYHEPGPDIPMSSHSFHCL